MDLCDKMFMANEATWKFEALLRQLDKDGVDSSGCTVLNMACRWGRLDVVELLLRAGADIEKADLRGQTPLMAASGSLGNGHVKIAYALLCAGAQKNTKDHDGWTALSHAVWTMSKDAAGLLIRVGADVDAVVANGEPLLAHAVFQGSLGICEMLLDAGADINKTDVRGKTALMTSLGRYDSEFIHLLLKRGADADRPSSNGVTPLMCACLQEWDAHVALLLLAGANIHKTDRDGHDASWFARHKATRGSIDMLSRAYRRDASAILLGLRAADNPLSLLAGFDHVIKFIIAMALPNRILKSIPELL